MYCGQAYLHQFEGDKKAHLWFVLSEPKGFVISVCVCMTTSHPVGEKFITIPANTTLTYGTKNRDAFVTDHESTLYINSPKLLREDRIKEVFTEDNCYGAIKDDWLWTIRRAVRASLKNVRGNMRAEVDMVSSAWFDGDGNPITGA